MFIVRAKWVSKLRISRSADWLVGWSGGRVWVQGFRGLGFTVSGVGFSGFGFRVDRLMG